MRSQQFAHSFHAMGMHIIHHDNIPRMQSRKQRVLQIGQEPLSGRSALVSGKDFLSVEANRRQYRCGFRRIEWCVICYSLRRRYSPVMPRQIGIDAAFVQKHQMFRQFRCDVFLPQFPLFLHIEDAHAHWRTVSSFSTYSPSH